MYGFFDTAVQLNRMDPIRFCERKSANQPVFRGLTMVGEIPDIPRAQVV